MSARGHSAARPFRVVIAGAGVAGLEGALALRDLCGPGLQLTLLAPQPSFVYRPMTVREPFAYAAARSYSVEALAREIGAELVPEPLARVDSEARRVRTATGTELAYDALLLALGARVIARYPRAITIDDRRMDEILHGLIEDVEGGYVHSLVFLIPARMAWPLPMYELALMIAGRASDMGAEMSSTLVTPEDSPLAIFGAEVSRCVATLLEDARISVQASSYGEMPEQGWVLLNPGERRLRADRVIALPELSGPTIDGLALGEHGFIAVDTSCQVRGVERVYAAGDATDFPVKHGGIAAQQADAAAQAIAALAGVPLEPKPFTPEIHGMLLTGGKPKFLSARISGGRGFSSHIGDAPAWSPPGKVAARYLAPYLDRQDRLAGHPSASEAYARGR